MGGRMICNTIYEYFAGRKHGIEYKEKKKK
jgi:hypothetical protein